MILLQDSLFPFSRTIRRRDSCWWMHFRQDVEEADPEVLTGEPCASLNIELFRMYHLQNQYGRHGSLGRTGDYYFSRMLLCIPAVQKDS